MVYGRSLEWLILILCLTALPIVFFFSKIYALCKRDHSHRWVTEALVGSMLKRMLPGNQFVKVRPDFLKYPKTNRNLELDFYCEELKVAVEYNGRQHYEYIPFFHKNDINNFDRQKRRDIFKRLACEKHGITLINVPYTIKNEDIYNYIMMEFIKHKIIHE